MKRLLSLLLMAWALLGLSLVADAQDNPGQPADDDSAASQAPSPNPNSKQAPPRSDVESSSKDSKIDLSPPPGDDRAHPDAGVADDVLEFHPYNPHRALKDVEVGDYYFKLKNYRAALSRYREALEWKPGDAEATLRLGRTWEKIGNPEEARARYEEYLKILPDGPGAAECHKALERLANPGKGTPTAKKK